MLHSAVKDLVLELEPGKALVLECRDYGQAKALVKELRKWIDEQVKEGVLVGHYSVRLTYKRGLCVVVRKVDEPIAFVVDESRIEELGLEGEEGAVPARITIYVERELAPWLLRWKEECGADSWGRAVKLALTSFLEDRYGRDDEVD